MTHPDHVRQRIAHQYSNHLEERGSHLAVLLDGTRYRAEELAGLPKEAVSLGCGDPLAFSGVQEGDTVVDLGSGAGLDLLLAARRVGPAGRVIGVEMADAMITRARENIARSGLSNVEVREGIIEALPLASSSVDWVISNCVLNLSPEKDKVFREIARVLKPGGRMLVSDIVMEGIPGWVNALASRFEAGVTASIGERAYVAGLRRAGLREVKVLHRLVYDRGLLEGVMRAEIEITGEAPRHPLARFLRSLRDRALGLLTPPLAWIAEGKVSSVKVFAQKSA